jgi:hypothetical protein
MNETTSPVAKYLGRRVEDPPKEVGVRVVHFESISFRVHAQGLMALFLSFGS